MKKIYEFLGLVFCINNLRDLCNFIIYAVLVFIILSKISGGSVYAHFIDMMASFFILGMFISLGLYAAICVFSKHKPSGMFVYLFGGIGIISLMCVVKALDQHNYWAFGFFCVVVVCLFSGFIRSISKK